MGIFQELLREIERVRYYPPKVPRPSAPPRFQAAYEYMANRKSPKDEEKLIQQY